MKTSRYYWETSHTVRNMKTSRYYWETSHIVRNLVTEDL